MNAKTRGNIAFFKTKNLNEFFLNSSNFSLLYYVSHCILEFFHFQITSPIEDYSSGGLKLEFFQYF